MTLRSNFRAKFSNSSLYPSLRTIYRNISPSIFSTFRGSVKSISSVLGLDVIFPRYSLISLPVLRPTIVMRGFSGVTLIGSKHYFSRKRIVMNYLENPEVQDFVSDIRDFSGLPVCPVSILESALIKEGVYTSKSIRPFQIFTPTHFTGNGQGVNICVPRESSFFHFFVQVVPYILRNSDSSKLWLDLDSETSNLEILQEFDLTIEESQTPFRIKRITRVANQAGHYPSSSETRLMRRKLTELGHSRVPTKSIYITRKGNSNGRRIQNEVELIDLLSRYNFEVVDPGMLSFKKQLSLFSQSKIVVAPHGAALSHILNFPSEARILELNGDSDVRWHIRKMAKDLGINHHLLLGKNAGDGSFLVNLELVKNFLKDTSSAF